MQIALPLMIGKRAGRLVVLFLGEILTAMGFFAKEIERAVVLVPSTLVIRALGEIALRDWWRVMRREVFSRLGLGLILGSIGFLRIPIVMC